MSQTRDPLRLLMVTPRYLPEMGGTELHVRETSRRLVQAGVDVTVLTTDPTGQLPSREESEGIAVRRVRAWPRRRDFYVAPALYREIVRGDWDLIHIQSYHTFVAPAAMLSALRSGTPYVLTFHGGGHSSRLRHRSRPLQRWALRPLLMRARRLICIASFEASDYGRELRLPEAQFVFIPNGVEPPAEQAEPPIPGLIASVGRLERYKGHHRVLAAFPLVLEQEPNARLWIAGAGPYERKLRKFAHDLGVADKVEIRAIPPERRAAMLREMGRVSLVVLLSEFETHPMAALEALSAGRRLVVADGFGLGELGRRKLARVVPRDASPAAVAAAIVEELRQPAAVPAVPRFTWDDCTAALLQLYETVRAEATCES